jgi:hypothetical protein
MVGIAGCEVKPLLSRRGHLTGRTHQIHALTGRATRATRFVNERDVPIARIVQVMTTGGSPRSRTTGKSRTMGES